MAKSITLHSLDGYTHNQAATANGRTREIKNVSLHNLIVPPWARSVDRAMVEALADDIARDGLYQPIGVVPNPDGGFTLMFGRHRVEAFRLLMERDPTHTDANPSWWASIPALVLGDGYGEVEQEAVGLIENLHRKELSAAARKIAVARLGILLTETGEAKVKTKAEAGKAGGAEKARKRKATVVPSTQPKVEVASISVIPATSSQDTDTVVEIPTVADVVAQAAGVTKVTVMRANADTMAAAKRAGVVVEDGETLPKIAAANPARARAIVDAAEGQMTTEGQQPKVVKSRAVKSAPKSSTTTAARILALIDGSDDKCSDILAEMLTLRPVLRNLMAQLLAATAPRI